MPRVEVEEGEFNQSKLAYELLRKLETSPKTRRKLFNLIKEENPQAVLPPDETEPVRQELGEVKTELGGKVEKLEGQLREFQSNVRSEREIESARSRLKASGWDAEGISKIEAVMVDKGITDYDIAAAWVEKQLPRPEPAEGSYSYEPSWDFSPADESDEVTKQLLAKNYKKATSLAVNQWTADKRAGKLA